MARSKSGSHPGGNLALYANPAWGDREVKPIEAYDFCHDGTPYLTVACACGSEYHLHLGQIEELPDNVGLMLPCRNCGDLLTTPVQFVKAAIRKAWKLDG